MLNHMDTAPLKVFPRTRGSVVLTKPPGLPSPDLSARARECLNPRASPPGTAPAGLSARARECRDTPVYGMVRLAVFPRARGSVRQMLDLTAF